ncbi:MAG: DUF1015 family protein [Spirochaetes bacterium]|jgi:uncharacterized protein (DUF1015 family)|nr:DUF1015 family protein [Spirochaetota bacterium]
MAKIKSINGVRPKRDLVALIAELPYDVVSIKEAKTRAKDNKYNFFHISLPEIDFPEGSKISQDQICEKGRENLERFQKEGIFFKDEVPKLYLYSQVMNGRMQTGLVACVCAEDYIAGKIKKHELVLTAKQLDRKRHIDSLNANTGLVFLFYNEDGSQKESFEKAMKIEPEYDFTTADGIRHIFRIISDKKLMEDFKEGLKNKNFYIADGHHRASAAVMVAEERKKKNPGHTGDEEYNWFLAVVFPHDQLKILSYNRVVKDLFGLSKDAFLEKLREKYTVEKTKNSIPSKPHRFSMYLDGEWYQIRPDFPLGDDPVKSLDTQILQDTVLDPILGIKKPTEDKRIHFIGGIRGDGALISAVDSGEYAVAFSLYPVSIEELIRVSDADKLMPPKSTWFEPKLRSGLVLHLLS